MRVLWLTSTSGGASKILNDKRPGRGWIASLGDLLKADKNIDLAVAFFNDPPNDFKFDFEGITYYPMADKLGTRTGQIKTRLMGKLWDTNLPGILKVIDDFKPDIIQIFGTESGMGDIVGKTKIPVIIHLQGLLNPYISMWLPRGTTLRDIFFKSSFRELVVRRDLVSDFKIFKKKARREDMVIKNAKYFFGRTDWDRRFVKLLNDEIEYFHCDEVLRPFIYENSGKWRNPANNTLKLVTTINAEMYKGLDIVLQTARILKSKTPLNFEWNIIGIASNNRIIKMMEKNRSCRFKNFPINFLGVKQGKEMISELLGSNMFIHPSHADNSPNSVCEAMLLGMPVIAGFVGGITSLINDKENGLLYNSNDPYDLAGIILQIANDREKLERLGRSANTTAIKRHDPTVIVETIKNTYKEILANDNLNFNGK